MQKWKGRICHQLDKGIADLCRHAGIIVIQGKGRFDSSRSLLVEKQGEIQKVKFKSAVIATGSSPIELPEFPFSHHHVISSSQALRLRSVPKNLAIIGGGYIGVQVATIYAKLGAKVTIIEQENQVLPMFERSMVALVQRRLKYLGAAVHTGSTASGLGERGGKAQVVVKAPGKTYVLRADYVLVSVGRRPNTSGIGVGNTNVRLARDGSIKVDKQMRTTDTGIFAVGDVTGRHMLAHAASRQGKVAAEAMNGLKSTYTPRAVPLVVESDPEIASVGISPSEARKTLDVKVGRFPLSSFGASLVHNKGEGFVQLVASKKTGKILGMQAVGYGAGMLAGEAALAIEKGLKAEDVANTIHAHPTMPESLMEAAEAVAGKAVHLFTL